MCCVRVPAFIGQKYTQGRVIHRSLYLDIQIRKVIQC